MRSEQSGLGIDWGVLFTRIDLVYNATKPANTKKDIKVPPVTCGIMENKKKTMEGVCSAYGTCIIGSVQYFGYFCHGLTSGKPCTVETTEYLTVSGVCTGVYCYTGQSSARYIHINCIRAEREKEKDRHNGMEINRNTDTEKEKGMYRIKEHHGGGRKDLLETNLHTMRNTEKIKDVKEETIKQNKEKRIDIKNRFSTKKSLSAKCRGLYNPQAYYKLVNICRDCFNLFKEPEVYSLCMGGCFDSQHFMHCAKILLVEGEKVKSLVNLVGK